MVRVLHWNGKDLPEELRELPAGRYVLESVDDVPALDDAEEAGLREGLQELDAGQGRSLEDVRRTIDSVLKR